MFFRSLSLEEMCFTVIVNNLESIVINRRIPQKSTDFLLRLYAAKVFHEYNKIEEDIKEGIMLWFLNPFAKEITLPRELYSEKIINRLQIVGMGITSLNMSESAAPENELNAIIRSVPCVEILDLSSTSCTDETLSIIHEVSTHLQNLTLISCRKVTDVGMKNLCGKNLSLKFLDLRDSGVHPEGVRMILREMPSLECIKVIDIFLEKLMDMNDMPQKYNLAEFLFKKIKGNSFEVIRMLTKKCPKIKKLYFEFPVKKDDLGACTEFQELEELKFEMPHDRSFHITTDNLLAPFMSISLNLKTLILSCMEIPTVMLVENFKNLEKLYLKSVSFTGFKEEDITCTENKLDTLVIKGIGFKDSSTTHKALVLLISLSKNVRKLNFKYTDNSPCDLFDVILNSMKNLSSVNFSGTKVEMRFLIPFFDIPSLKMIYISSYKCNLYDTFAEKRKFLGRSSSTLSWRIMDDSDIEDFDDDHEDNFISNFCGCCGW